MPEGPSIVILKEQVASFKKQKVLAATGNTKKIDMHRIDGETVKDFKSWGKHFLICFDGFTIKIHFLLFGSYLINEEKDAQPRLSLKFKKGVLNFYACSVTEIEGSLDEVYDWSADVMSKTWDEDKAREKLKANGDLLVCDAILDQDIFAGAGNIIKNEVLYRIRVHPKTKVKDLPKEKLDELLKEVVHYSFQFLEWKKEYTLKSHWLAHTKKICHRCNLPILKAKMGKTNRRTFYCEGCQVNY